MIDFESYVKDYIYNNIMELDGVELADVYDLPYEFIGNANPRDVIRINYTEIMNYTFEWWNDFSDIWELYLEEFREPMVRNPYNDIVDVFYDMITYAIHFIFNTTNFVKTTDDNTPITLNKDILKDIMDDIDDNVSLFGC